MFKQSIFLIVLFLKIKSREGAWISASDLTAGVGFADTLYSVSVAENCAGNTVVKTLLLTNKPAVYFPLRCTLESGDEKGHFDVIEDSNRDCKLVTRGQQLDYESQQMYTLTVRLFVPVALIDPSRSIARIIVNVKDVNDNRPTFVVDGREVKSGETQLAVVPKNAPAQSFILRVQAEDRDSNENGRIQYSIDEDIKTPSYFTISSNLGVITNVRTFDSVRTGALKMSVTARDRPNDPTDFLSSTISVVVNLIEDSNRMVLVLPSTPPERTVELKKQIIDFLQERSGLIIGIEKVEIRRLASSNATTLDARGSDVTFYAIDPRTQHLIHTDDPRIQSIFFSNDGQYALLSALSQGLRVEASTIRQPWPSSFSAGILFAAKTVEETVDGFQAALLALASIVGVLGVTAIVYLCFLWSRHSAFQNRLQHIIGSPHVEPVLIEPSLKEYETQVLQMMVNGDDYLSTIKGPPSPRMHVLDTSLYTDETSSDSLDSPSYGNEDDDNALMVPALNPIYQSSDENSPHQM